MSTSTEQEVVCKISEQNNATNGSTTAAADPVGTLKEKLNAGKRHLACDENPQAVEAFAEACELLSEKYGEEGDEVAEAYFYYGKSLLELARMENGVLGNALDGVAAEEENENELSESEQFGKASKMQEDEREAIIDEVYSAMSAEEKEEAAKSDTKGDETETKAEETTEKEAVAEAEAAADSKAEATTEKSAAVEGETPAAKSEDAGAADDEKVSADDEAAVEDEEGDGPEAMEDDEAVDSAESCQEDGNEADDIPNLQLAWEVLELAKKIYERQGEAGASGTPFKVKLSEVHRVLGEVSLETGTYSNAIQDITSCLDIQRTCMDADSRLIAETHYQLGNAHLLNKAYASAVEQLRQAKSVIETRISNLSKNTSDEGKEKREKELQDLKEILPDITAKVEDAEDESRNSEKAEMEVKAMLSSQKDGASTTIGFGDSASHATEATTIIPKKANDISNLVRKRKPEEQESTEEAKKAKPDTVSADGDKENGTAVDASAPKVSAN